MQVAPVRRRRDALSIVVERSPVAAVVPGRLLPVPVVAPAALSRQDHDQLLSVTAGGLDDAVDGPPVTLLGGVVRCEALERPEPDRGARERRRGRAASPGAPQSWPWGSRLAMPSGLRREKGHSREETSSPACSAARWGDRE